MRRVNTRACGNEAAAVFEDVAGIEKGEGIVIGLAGGAEDFGEEGLVGAAGLGCCATG